jgi:hypothetical protein
MDFTNNETKNILVLGSGSGISSRIESSRIKKAGDWTAKYIFFCREKGGHLGFYGEINALIAGIISRSPQRNRNFSHEVIIMSLPPTLPSLGSQTEVQCRRVQIKHAKYPAVCAQCGMVAKSPSQTRPTGILRNCYR